MKNSIVNIPDYSIANLKESGSSFLGRYEHALSKENQQYVIDYFKTYGLNICIRETYYGYKDNFRSFKTIKSYYSYIILLL
jgi:hypothetical protein